MEEYSVEWFKWHWVNNSKWLGTQAIKLLGHYIQLEGDNKFLAKTAAKTAAKNVQIDGLLGYACVLESMLHKQGTKLPPRPSLMIEQELSVASSDET